MREPVSWPMHRSVCCCGTFASWPAPATQPTGSFSSGWPASEAAFELLVERHGPAEHSGYNPQRSAVEACDGTPFRRSQAGGSVVNDPTIRQAVLLIHGIGEQRPMSNLRDFVAALVGDHFRSKPDDLSLSF